MLETNHARARAAFLVACSQGWQETEHWLREAGDAPVDRLLRAEAQLVHRVDEAGAEAALYELARMPDLLGARAASLLAWRLWRRGEFGRFSEVAAPLTNLAPEALGTQLLLGTLREFEGERAAALAHFRRGVEMRPQSAEALSALSNALLLRHQLKEGFACWAEKDRIIGIYPLTEQCPVWRGEPLGAKRLLVHCTHGYGDRIQLMRFAAWLREREPRAELTASVGAPLLRLVRAAGLFDHVVEGADVRQYDAQVTCFELGALLDLEGAGVWRGPYLRVEKTDIESAAPWLPPRRPGVRRVGLRWSGSVSELNPKRNVPPQALRMLLGMEGIEWVALMEDAAQVQEGVDFSMFPAMLNVGSRLADFYQTGALMHQLDLVISVDTASAHLAGALGLPTWVLTRADFEWRWDAAGATTPWYGSVRTFRHPPQRMDWEAVTAQVADALGYWVRTGCGVMQAYPR